DIFSCSCHETITAARIAKLPVVRPQDHGLTAIGFFDAQPRQAPVSCRGWLCDNDAPSAPSEARMPHSIDDALLPNFPAAMGVSLQEVSDSRIVGVMDVTDEHANRNGVMHGGAIMAFADSLGGVAAAA